MVEYETKEAVAEQTPPAPAKPFSLVQVSLSYVAYVYKLPSEYIHLTSVLSSAASIVHQ